MTFRNCWEPLIGSALFLGLTTGDLHPLFSLLKGDPDLSSPRILTTAGALALDKVAQAIENQQS